MRSNSSGVLPFWHRFPCPFEIRTPTEKKQTNKSTSNKLKNQECIVPNQNAKQSAFLETKHEFSILHLNYGICNLNGTSMEDLSDLWCLCVLFSCWCSTGSDKSVAPAPKLFAAILFPVFYLLCQNNKTGKILKICWQGQTAHTASRQKIKKEKTCLHISTSRLTPQPFPKCI